ncbi:MAG: peptide ABC transporter substrate-binding protein [Phycisphaerae bacterium]|nr:peptide ABC transporter substrate-binding protein [Phycisphaerae bacterium]
MFRVVMIVGLVALALVAVWVGTSPGVSRGDFVYAAAYGINTLDPAQMSWTNDIRVAINIWEGLTCYHPETTEPIAGVAEFPPEVSDDGLTYKFTIRADARWCNGDPVTAADFARGWRRAVEPGTAMDYARLLVDNIAGLQGYYTWRNEAVAVLTALARLADGRGVDAQAAEMLYLHAELGEVAAAAKRVRTARTRRCDFHQALSVELSEMEVEWEAIHRRWLHRHAAECDERFARTGIAAVGDSFLQVRLERPCPYFLDLCAFPTFMPIHESIEMLREHYQNLPLTRQGLVVYDQQWTKPNRPRPTKEVCAGGSDGVGSGKRGYPGLITNGPFMLTEWSFKRRMRLTRNPFYHAGDRVAVGTIDRVVYIDANTAVMAYEAGEVDFLPGMEVHYAHKLIELSGKGLRPDFHNPVVLATHFYIFNCRDAEVFGQPNPFTDARVRRAFNLAVDRNLLVEKVLGCGEPPSGHLVPVGSIAGYQSPVSLGYDPSQARRLLSEAGYPGGASLPVIDLLHKTSGADEKTCVVLARMWRETLGVRVELRGKEPKAFAEDKVKGLYMIARAGWYGDYNDPTTFLDIFRTDNGNNDSGYANADYDALLDQADGLGPGGVLSGRMALLARAEALLICEDCPLLPLYQHTNLMAIKPYVQGLYPNRRLIFPFRYVEIGER